MFSSSSSECDCDFDQYVAESEFADNFCQNWTNPVYDAMKYPFIYYAQIPQPLNSQHYKKERRNKNWFVKAFQWYTQERTINQRNRRRFDYENNLPEFSAWLDNKYEHYLKENLDRSTFHMKLKQTSTFEANTLPTNNRLQAKRRSLSQDGGDGQEKTNGSFEYILRPKNSIECCCSSQPSECHQTPVNTTKHTKQHVSKAIKHKSKSLTSLRTVYQPLDPATLSVEIKCHCEQNSKEIIKCGNKSNGHENKDVLCCCLDKYSGVTRKTSNKYATEPMLISDKNKFTNFEDSLEQSPVNIKATPGDVLCQCSVNGGQKDKSDKFYRDKNRNESIQISHVCSPSKLNMCAAAENVFLETNNFGIVRTNKEPFDLFTDEMSQTSDYSLNLHEYVKSTRPTFLKVYCGDVTCEDCNSK
ncbi:uncharacterized protein LOC114250314 [Bombyx mandarina]|uniref:Uncharacterized protein LOC114250314 n=1 Tax=Bombyx mandarina TaxID=7092 RepID=A0A6J2KG64_BOMMA|nr:uncharacterized protein LOC114250314 [Bombyx mandarina]